MDNDSRAIIAYLHSTLVHAEFCTSLLAMCTEGRTQIETVIGHACGPNLSVGRNFLCRKFLNDSSAPWLLMCDTDMWFPADTVDRLIEAADPVDRPVVGGLYLTMTIHDSEVLSGSSATAGRVIKHPTMYEFVSGPGSERIVAYLEWPEDSLVKVGGTGAGCLLIHRSALETIEKTSGDASAPWFRETDTDVPMSLMGEDLTFCLRCAAAEVPVYVHTGVRVGHLKTQMLLWEPDSRHPPAPRFQGHSGVRSF
jgi:hypothetical protein